MKALAIVLLGAHVAAAAPAKVGPGIYRPAFPASPAEREVKVAAFWLDREPVTNADYRAFVTENPAWQREHAKSLLVDAHYLDGFSAAAPNAPVVRVSWFAARAYCAWRGGRLPREAEWELAANDGTSDEQILAWYAAPAPAQLPAIGGPPNKWGVRDLHGLVWEWIDDFTASLITADSRDPTRSAVCGAEAAAAKDPRAYATFMRIAFRGSLQARDTVGTLGFRCAYDQETR